MIHFVATRDHRYTLRALREGRLGQAGFRYRLHTYEALLRARSLPGGTWIFLDIERLSDAERRRVSVIACRLEAAGLRVLNHPLRAAGRYALQRRLYAARINDFETLRVEERRMPLRWPVFVRFENDHHSPDARLLEGPEQLKAVLDEYRARGVPESSLLIVEYRGASGEDGLWRKYSAYRVGEHIIHHHMVRQDTWVAKYGNPAAVKGDDHWRQLRVEERDFVQAAGDPLGLMAAFEAGGIDYGRADFGIVDGRVKVYEINTNPTLGSSSAEDDPFLEIPRAPLIALANLRILDALRVLDSHADSRVRVAEVNFIRALPWRPAKRP